MLYPLAMGYVPNEMVWMVFGVETAREVGLGLSVNGKRELSADLWAPPPPTFVDRRADAADNLSARRRCHVGVFSYFVAFFDD